jgi:hypothetical protein
MNVTGSDFNAPAGGATRGRRAGAISPARVWVVCSPRQPTILLDYVPAAEVTHCPEQKVMTVQYPTAGSRKTALIARWNFRRAANWGTGMQKRPLSIERITDDNQRIFRLRDQDAEFRRRLTATIESGRETGLVGGARSSAFRWRRNVSEKKAVG